MVLGAVVVFYFYGSKGVLSQEEYITISHYQPGSERIYRSGDTLRAMTYNIGYLSGMTNNSQYEFESELFEANLGKAINLLIDLKPDVVGLQEIDYASHRSFYVHQADEIGEDAGFLMGFHSVNWDKQYVPFPYGLPKYNFGRMLSGQSLLSQFPMANEQHLVLRKPQNAAFYYKAFYIDRLIQQSDWIVGEDTIKVMNLHLEAFDRPTRLDHAMKVREEYLKVYEQYPVLIMGDFNSRAEFIYEDAMSIIMSAPGIRSAIDQSQYEQDSTGYFTYSAASPVYMIDYILYNETRIKKVTSRVANEAGEVSDHLPVIMDFVLSN
jgi:endonuclease/exonuclease/phosphatase family metal-dependent hydrolase